MVGHYKGKGSDKETLNANWKLLLVVLVLLIVLVGVMLVGVVGVAQLACVDKKSNSKSKRLEYDEC